MPCKKLQTNQPKQYIQCWVEFYKQSLKNSTKDIPKAYINGYVEFYKLKFRVTPNVLIPRPETELLIDHVFGFIKQLPTTNYEQITILDLGTGAGNIAISLACNLKGCNLNIIATDISAIVLKVAKQNAKLHGVENRIKFIKSDLLTELQGVTRKRVPFAAPAGIPRTDEGKLERQDPEQIDIIVTNLPYIPSARIPFLDSSVKDFEPHVALDGGKEGFELYRKLFKQLKERNWHPKLIIGEIDYTHGELAIIESLKYFPKAEVEVKYDLAHLQRILIIRHP